MGVYGVPTDHPVYWDGGREQGYMCVGVKSVHFFPQALVLFHCMGFIHGDVHWLSPGTKIQKTRSPPLSLFSQETKQSKVVSSGPTWECLGARAVRPLLITSISISPRHRN